MSRIQSTLLLIILAVFSPACTGQTLPTLTPTPEPVTQEARAETAIATPKIIPTATPAPVMTATAPANRNNPGDGVIAFYSDRDGNPEIYTSNAQGTDVIRLTYDPGFDDSPSISPDGGQIVFLTARHDPEPKFPNLKYEIYVMDIDGNHLKRLTETESGEDHPAWSPDGSQLLFDADYDGDGFYEIYKMHPDGSQVNRLTSNKANDQFADWSPDGEYIAFSSDRDGNWDIYVMHADGTQQQALTESDVWELFPAWSPDGSQIAFNGLRPNSRNTDVYVMSRDGSGVKQLTITPRFDENPAWSPDGSQIIFQTERDGNFELYIMNKDGSNQHPLATNPADEMWPSWRPTGTLPDTSSTDGEPVLAWERSKEELGLRETFQAALGDIDGDGDLDAVFANPMRNNAEVWLNDGSGTFQNTGQQLTQYGHGVGLADFDNDGDANFSDSGMVLDADTIAWGDIDGDGYRRP